jgi:hypothetical protein
MQQENSIERQVVILTRICDNQAQKIENLEDALFELLSLFNTREDSSDIENILKTFLHNSNLFRKKEKYTHPI